MDNPEQKEQLREMVTKLYQECGITIEPLYPKVLVRVLPKEQKTKGGVILPDAQQQNKPTHEGVVLKTYKPFFRKVYVEDVDWRKDDWDQEAKYQQLVKCELQPGDHVVFPYMEFGITPVTPLDDAVGDYRLVPEPVIQAKLEYDRETTVEWLKKVIDLSDDLAGAVIESLMRRADIIRRDLTSLTISGA